MVAGREVDANRVERGEFTAEEGGGVLRRALALVEVAAAEERVRLLAAGEVRDGAEDVAQRLPPAARGFSRRAEPSER